MKAWNEFLEKQKKNLGNETFDKWLKEIQVAHFDARNLYLEVSSPFHETWFKQHIKPILHLKNDAGNPVKVHIGIRRKKQPSRNHPGTQLQFTPSELNNQADFANIISLKENKEVSCLLKALVPDNEKRISLGQFNPICIFGPKGSGKTLFLHAIAKQLAKSHRVFFVTAQRFADHVVGAIRQFRMQEFRSIYRNVDIFIIDDLDIFSSKNATQEEFFHTFNALHFQKKQIIVSCSDMPQKLDLEPRIISRLEWGLALPLKKPDQESLELFLLEKQNRSGYQLCPKTRQHILSSAQCQMHSISLFFDILAFKYEKGMIPYAKVSELLSSCFHQALTPEFIIEKTAKIFDTTSKDLLGKSQKKEVSFPRQIGMYLCRLKLKMPYQKIGKFFQKDHSTIINGIKQIEALLQKKDPAILRSLQLIEKEVDSLDF
jgi:chromosomal replication initiator protein